MSPYELSNSRNRLNKSLGVFFSRHIFARCQIKKPCVICLNSLSLHLSISDRSILCKYNPSVLSAMADPCFIGRIRGKKVIVCMDLQEPCEMPNPDLCCSQWLGKKRTVKCAIHKNRWKIKRLFCFWLIHTGSFLQSPTSHVHNL